MDAKATHCIFIGYFSDKKGYRVWDSLAKKVIVSRDVIFYENYDTPAMTQKTTSKVTPGFQFIDSSDDSDEERPENSTDTFDLDMNIRYVR